MAQWRARLPSEGQEGESKLFGRAGKPSSIASMFRDIRFDAKRHPDVAGRNAGGQRLVGRASVGRKNKIAGQHAPVAVAKLIFYCLAELTQTHASTLTD